MVAVHHRAAVGEAAPAPDCREHGLEFLDDLREQRGGEVAGVAVRPGEVVATPPESRLDRAFAVDDLSERLGRVDLREPDVVEGVAADLEPGRDQVAELRQVIGRADNGAWSARSGTLRR